jgi:glycosyltransferase involved in cell wall biosynthesis
VTQELSEPFEIVIGEDCSTDGTAAIVREFADRFPHLIRLMNRQQNLGWLRNFACTLSECRGSYIAILDSDDYWLAADKLHRQIQTLDSRPDCSICGTRAFVFTETLTGETNEGDNDILPDCKRNDFTLADLLNVNFIVTSSAVFRRSLIPQLPAWYGDLPFGDWALFLILACHGNIVVLPEVMVAYRRHPKGNWSTLTDEEVAAKRLQVYTTIEPHLDPEFSPLIRKFKAREVAELFLRQRTRAARNP